MDNTIIIDRVANGIVVKNGNQATVYGMRDKSRKLALADLEVWMRNPNRYERRLKRRVGERRFRNVAGSALSA